MTPWASGDVCKALDIDRSTLRYFRQSQAFPAPRWTVSTGDLWDRAEVIAWHKTRQSTKRARYADGLHHYRRDPAPGRLARAAAAAGVHPDTFRAYLREVGEPLPQDAS